jgi:hypothetical protein
MREHSGVLIVPAEELGGKQTLVEVRVPLLGAFAVDRTVTFPQRSAGADDAGAFKRAKDLLYLRDLMAAGSEVTEHIEREIKAFKADASRTPDLLGKAAGNLRLLQGGQWTSALREAARMLVERGDESSEDAAIADIRGYVDDFLDLLTGSDS